MKREDNVHFYFNELEEYSNGKKYRVQLEIPMNVGWIDSTFFVIDGKKIPMKFVDNKDGHAIFSVDCFLEQKAVCLYYFEYEVNNKRYFINRRNTKTTIEYDEKNKISVMFDVPEWAKDAVMYHIIVDRFHRGSSEPLEENPRRTIHKDWEEDVVLGSNPNVLKRYPNEEVWNVDFFGGDLKGIEDKLDYLKSLGVTILYLSPIVSSQSNHRYDTADYEKLDSYVGTYEDLKRLCDAAHKRGMKVVLDAVFNHVGDESKYFDRYHEYPTGNSYDDGTYQNPNSKYHDFFRYDYRGNHTFWWDFTTLPELNCDSPYWRKYICGEGGVLDKWFSCGIDGVRLDVADNLSDAALEEIHKAVIRNKKDGLILGEVWENPMRNGRSYISSGRSMHSVMNYPLADALVRYLKYQDDSKLRYVIRDTQAEYPADTIHTLMNFTSTHDISRIITLLGKKKFDTYHRFHELDKNLQGRIYEVLWEIGYNNDDIFALLNGHVEMDYYTYQNMMERLKWKGISNDTISYLRSVLSYTPFDKNQVWAKDLPEDIKKDLDYTRKYKLTPEEYQEAIESYKKYLFFLSAYPGILSFFYGDEAGMEGLNNLANRGSFPWNHINAEILSYCQKIGLFRKNNNFLKNSDYRLIDLDSNHVMYERFDDNHSMLLTLNNTDSDTLYIPDEYKDGRKVLTLKKSNNNSNNTYSGVIIEK